MQIILSLDVSRQSLMFLADCHKKSRRPATLMVVDRREVRGLENIQSIYYPKTATQHPTLVAHSVAVAHRKYAPCRHKQSAPRQFFHKKWYSAR